MLLRICMASKFTVTATTKTIIIVNPVVPNATYLYPLKISENLTVSRCFRGVREMVYWGQIGI